MRIELESRSALLVVTLLTAAVFSISFPGCSKQGGEQAPTVGSRLDTGTLQLVDLDGKRIDLRDVSAGQVRVVVFTRTDCPVSNQAAPEVRSLYNEFLSQAVDFYLVYVDPTQDPNDIREHLRQYEYPCEAVRDPKHSLVAQTGATVTPEAVVFNSNWQIAYRGRINDKYEEVGKSRGNSNRHNLRDAIEATLAGKPVAEPIVRPVGCYISDLK